MKKILFPIVVSIMVLLLTSLVAYATPEKVTSMRKSFDIVGQEFFQRGTHEQAPDGGMFISLADETGKEKYYLSMSINGAGIITMVNASVQIELANNVVEVSNEGLAIDYEIRDYKHYADRKLVFRNENCRMEKMEPKEGVWYTVLGKLFLNNKPE